MKPRRLLLALGIGTGMLVSVGGNQAAAQVSVTAECVLNSGPTCTLIRFLISSGLDPVALTTFAADFAPASGWLFAGGPTGSFAAEDDFSFGVPYGGSTSITNGGLSLFIAFVSPPTFELAPFSSGGYIEVATTGSGDTNFQYTAEDPDAQVVAGPAPLSDPPVTSTPEPATTMLVAIGLAGLAGFSGRRNDARPHREP